MCILLNVKKHEKTFALNVDIFTAADYFEKMLTNQYFYVIVDRRMEELRSFFYAQI